MNQGTIDVFENSPVLAQSISSPTRNNAPSAVFAPLRVAFPHFHNFVVELGKCCSGSSKAIFQERMVCSRR